MACLYHIDTVPFEDLCRVLDNMFKKKGKIQEQDKILLDFINNLKLKVIAAKDNSNKSGSLFPVLRLLLPDLERERGAYNLKQNKLAHLLIKVLSLSKTSPDAQKLINFTSQKNNAQGSDLASVAYYVLKSRVGDSSGHLTVGDINDSLDKISAAEVGNKGTALDEVFSYVLRNTTQTQQKWFLRIVLKDLMLAVGKTRILSAVHPDAPELYDGCSSLLKVCEELDDSNTRPLELGIKLFTAVSPMLSERLAITRLSTLKQDKHYFIEEKFDGERFQIHMQNDTYEYFSRRGFSYSDKYGKSYDSGGFLTPLLKDCFSPGVTSFILDGEMMGWHKQYECFGSKGMAFDIKKVTENTKYRPCFCVFDLLYYNGKTLVGPADKGGVPLQERLKILDAMFKDIPGVIMHSKRELVKNDLHILDVLNKVIQKEEEGVVLKEVDSYYIANRRNAGWYKIKAEYSEGAMEDLDLVIIGADYAENKRQGLARSFIVACADCVAPGEMPRRWLSVGRVATGLSFNERERLCRIFENHWKQTKLVPPPAHLVFNKEKPDLWIDPAHSIVLTVHASELIRSKDFATEYTLRFQRVSRVRDDKPVKDTMTVDELNALVANKGPVVKLSTKQINHKDIATSGNSGTTTRKRKASKLRVAEQFLTKPLQTAVEAGAAGEGGEAASHALRGRKVCVLSDEEDCSKEELEAIVMRHGGIVVQNISSSTWCCVAGRKTVRVRNALHSRQADVATAAWLRALPPAPLPCPAPAPIDLLAMTSSTQTQHAAEYDEFGDSYTSSVDEDTLRRIFKKMDEETNCRFDLVKSEMIDLDHELFGENNPLSFLRPCCIHFTDKYSLLSIKARFYGAAIRDISDPDLSHVIAKRIEDVVVNKDDVLVLSEDWLGKCLVEKRLVPEETYLIRN